MQEVKILVWCDQHGDERVEGAPSAVIHPATGERVELDLCPPCRADIDAALAPVIALLEKVAPPARRGRGGDRVSPNGKKYACPLSASCGKEPLVFRSMVQHVRQAHPAQYERWKEEQDAIRAGGAQEELPTAV